MLTIITVGGRNSILVHSFCWYISAHWQNNTFSTLDYSSGIDYSLSPTWPMRTAFFSELWKGWQHLILFLCSSLFFTLSLSLVLCVCVCYRLWFVSADVWAVAQYIYICVSCVCVLCARTRACVRVCTLIREKLKSSQPDQEALPKNSVVRTFGQILVGSRSAEEVFIFTS